MGAPNILSTLRMRLGWLLPMGRVKHRTTAGLAKYYGVLVGIVQMNCFYDFDS
jgi:hypothetical protein